MTVPLMKVAQKIKQMKEKRSSFTFSNSSHRRCAVKKDVLKNFTNFTGKHLCWRLSLIKLLAGRHATLLKRDSAQVLCFEIFEIPILRNTYLCFSSQTDDSKYKR